MQENKITDFAYKKLPVFGSRRTIDRGFAVTGKCHRHKCVVKIDRGAKYLCWQCGWYYCQKHLRIAKTKRGELIELTCFAGVSAQVCNYCLPQVIKDFEAIDWND